MSGRPNAVPPPITTAGFGALLLVALLMGANHVAARVAFNDGVDVNTAVAFRSSVTACVLALLLRLQAVPFVFQPRHRLALPAIGLLIAVQSVCLYSAVARLPVALALLAFNSHPLATALWEWLLYRKQPPRALLWAMPVILLGLALALDVLGAASGLGAAAHWGQIGAGVAFALGASLTFGLALVITQHEAGDVDGRLRSFTTMAQVGVLAVAVLAFTGGPQLPATSSGWIGLAALTVLYGSGFTLMFTVLPKLGVGGYSAIMNVEPIFALLLAWAVLSQAISGWQVVGGLIVVAAVMSLGLRRH
jgi:drug/metabolite transporter (DMT)-like permease